MFYGKNYFRFLISALIAVTILTGAIWGQVAPPSGIIGWYAGDGDFRDSSGNGNDATPAAGALSPTFLVGMVGQAFNLNGTPQYATIPDSAALRPQSLTIEGWVRTSSTGTQVVFAKSLGGGNFNSYALFYNNLNIRGVLCNNTGCLTLITPFTLNVWHHIAFSYDDPGGAATKTARLYVDGVLRATDATGGTIGYDTNSVVIGADFEFGVFNFGWSGELDEITFYNRALSLSEIQSINTAGINGKTKQADTNAGANLQTQVGDVTLTFQNVSTDGTTSNYTIDPTTAGTLPMGYTHTGLGYEISTTAAYSGLITECFHIPAITDDNAFVRLKVLHSEGGMLIDKTISTNTATRVVCGQTTSLSPFVIANGLTPTAASVAVGGRVAVGKNGLAQARVTLTDMNGETRSVMTSSFGYFRFDEVPAGATYIISVNHRRYIFAPQVLSVVEEITELNFTAEQ